MGISLLKGPLSEAAPHEPLRDPPTFEYYPSKTDLDSTAFVPVCKLSVASRNHREFEGDTAGIIYGTLDVKGQSNSDAVGFTFKFEDVRFKMEALNVVWSIRASVYVRGYLVMNGTLDLPGILVTQDPITPAEPVVENDPPNLAEHKFSTF